ncbi:MAG: hypothetical protein Q8O52_25540 [Sulfuritalea sp.]|nr:hypothetical protein [Sulfuritalea sp.]
MGKAFESIKAGLTNAIAHAESAQEKQSLKNQFLSLFYATATILIGRALESFPAF